MFLIKKPIKRKTEKINAAGRAVWPISQKKQKGSGCIA